MSGQPQSPHFPGLPHIHLVEDDDDTCEALVHYLRARGYAVSTSASAEEGLVCIERDKPDLVLADYALPAQSGTWLLEQALARGIWPAYGAMVFTAYRDVTAPPDVPIFRKPVDLDELMRAIAQKLATRARTSAPHLHSVPTGHSPGRASLERYLPPSIELALYVCAGSLASDRAVRNLQRILAEYDSSRLSMEVLDVNEVPNIAARDRVDFTPALVKRAPEPRMWLLGDFSEAQPLRDLLDSHGLELLK